MDGVRETVGHPLFLLLVGAVVSGALVPRLTQHWQDQRKMREIKTDLVERVTLAVTEMFTATQFAQAGATSQTQADFDTAYRAWQHRKAILTALLRVYFRSPAVDDAWLRCRTLTSAYYAQAGIAGAGAQPAGARRQAYLQRVARGLALEPPRDWAEEVGTEDEGQAPATDGLDLADGGSLRAEVRTSLNRAVEVIADSKVRL